MSKREIVVRDVEPTHAVFVLPARLEVKGERVDATEVLDVLLAGSEPQGLGVETERVDSGGREQREAVARASVAPVPFSSRWTTMTSDPASSSRPAIRLHGRTRRGG